MSEEHNADETAENPPSVNRRSILKALGTAGGVAAFGTAAIGTSAAANSTVELTELSGQEADRVISKAISSTEFRKLKKHTIKRYGVSPDIPNVEAYRVQDGEEIRYGVEVPIPGINNAVQSSIVIVIENETVTNALGGIAYANNDQLTKYTQFKITTDGRVTSESVSLETKQDRQKLLDKSTASDITTQSQCSDCVWVVERLCGWGCGITAAFFCALIGIPFPIGGIGCAVFFAIYCFEIGVGDACFYTGSARGDCGVMGYC